MQNAGSKSVSAVQGASEECDVCHKPLQWPENNDPAFAGKTAVTSGCRHMIRSYPYAESEVAPVEATGSEAVFEVRVSVTHPDYAKQVEAELGKVQYVNSVKRLSPPSETEETL